MSSEDKPTDAENAYQNIEVEDFKLILFKVI